LREDLKARQIFLVGFFVFMPLTAALAQPIKMRWLCRLGGQL